MSSAIEVAAVTGAAIDVGTQLSETARRLDDIARSTCLLALDVAMRADKPAAMGKSLIEASRDVRQLAARTAGTFADLEAMLKTVESGPVDAGDDPAIAASLAAYRRS